MKAVSVWYAKYSVPGKIAGRHKTGVGNITSRIHLSEDISFEMKMTVTPRKHATLNCCNCILGNFKRHKGVDLDLTYITVQHSSDAYALAVFFYQWP